MARPLILFLLSVLALACAAPPPAVVTVSADAAPRAQVAAARDAEPVEVDEPFVEDPDPGPVPIHAGDPSWGRRDAPVTIVEYGDFQCPFCARATATLAELKRRYGPETLRIVWKHNPLPFHPQAAAAALISARAFARFGNAGFWRVHDTFFINQRDLAGVVEAEAQRLGMSSADLEDRALVDRSLEEAKRVGATGAPYFFINGVLLSGAQPVEKFVEVIDDQRTKAEGLVSGRGTPRGRVYVELAKVQWSPPAPPPAPKVDIEDNTVWLVPVGKSPVRGKATALVTIVEFSDFQCPFCNRVVPTLAQVMAKYGDDVRLVFKNQPLPFHVNAAPAAELALEARAERGEAGFWRAHDLLFGGECQGAAGVKTRADCDGQGGQWTDNQRHLDLQDLLGYAAKLGLNAKRAPSAIVDKAHEAQIAADQALAEDLKANGTPTFFINGRRFVGAQPLEKFEAVIDQELAKARALVKGGVRPAEVYARIMASAKSGSPLEKRAVAAPTAKSPSRGPANAKVVVQMWSDFQCPFCQRVKPTIEELEKAFPGKIRVVWRNLPLSFHAHAELAAEAAMEAFAQKGDAGFWAMFELLYAAQGQPGGLERQALEQYAAQLGLDGRRFAQALDSRAHAAQIEADAKAASDAQISGTPAFVINGYYVSGAQPLAAFKRVVRAALDGK